MSIDVIIPACRPDERLDLCISMLQKQTAAPSRIRIFLTTDSAGEVEEYNHKYGGAVEFEQVFPCDFYHGGTRQLGVDTSVSDYVLLMTQDAVPYDEYLVSRLIDAVNEPGTAAAYARQTPYPDANAVEKFSRRFNYPSKSRTQTLEDMKTIGIKAIFCSNTCAMYNRSILNSLGGFDRTAKFSEDGLFAYQALTHGYSVRYCAEARVYHSHESGLVDEFRRGRMIADNQRLHPEIYKDLKSESEGLRYVRTGVRYFLGKKKPCAAFDLILRSGIKYAGYFTGKMCKQRGSRSL